VTPDCKTPAGCPIPPLDRDGRRALQIRSLIVRLHNLVGADSVLRICDADLEDLALLAIIEDNLPDEKDKDHGERHPADHRR